MDKLGSDATISDAGGLRRSRGEGRVREGATISLTVGIFPETELTEAEREALNAYEGAVVACTEWVRQHVTPGTEEWRFYRGRLDCFVRWGISARERFGRWPDHPGRMRDILHPLEKLLGGAYGAAGAESREKLEPYVQVLERLTSRRGAGMPRHVR